MVFQHLDRADQRDCRHLAFGKARLDRLLHSSDLAAESFLNHAAQKIARPRASRCSIPVRYVRRKNRDVPIDLDLEDVGLEFLECPAGKAAGADQAELSVLAFA
jgi:hypothetical protein